MPTILVDDFNGSGSWDSNNWPYVQNQDETFGFKAVRTKANGLGTTTNASKDYAYARAYFNTGERYNYGVHVKGRFRGATTGEGVRFFLRGGRQGRNNNDWTFPATGLVATIQSGSSGVELLQLLNSNVTTFSPVSITAPGTNWWNFRLEVEDNEFRAKFWFDFMPEPAEWGRVGTLPDGFPPGEAGFAVGYRANQVMDFEFFSSYNFENVVSLAGQIASRGSLRRRVSKRFAGSVAPQGFFDKTRTVFRNFVGTIAPSGATSHTFLREFSGSIAARGTLTRNSIAKRFAGSVLPQGLIGFGFVRRFEGVISPSGTLAVKFIGRIVGRSGLISASFARAAHVRAWFSERGSK